jgi:hypothetical protein
MGVELIKSSTGKDPSIEAVDCALNWCPEQGPVPYPLVIGISRTV